jgi:sarcosine oxidase subunit gamma
MQAAGLQVEATPNQAFRQSDGGLCAVLAPGEALVLSGLGGGDALVRRLESGWTMADPRDTYAVPRASTHAWFRITGMYAPAMFAKICGVDLRPHKFAELAIAQTSVVKLTGIIIREDVTGIPGFHLLADSASAEYVWDCVLDAMDEFGGRPAGLPALRELAGLHEAADVQHG